MTKRRRSSGGRKAAEARFWVGRPPEGAPVEPEAAGSDAGVRSIRPTPDPGAVVRSLGAPPLAVDATVAERHLTAVYEEAVRAATALAAANGMLADEGDDR